MTPAQAADPDMHGHFERALWHLQLDPEQLYWDCRDAPPAPQIDNDDWDEEWDDEYSCTRCGGEGFTEVDDPLWDKCDEFGWGPCNACHGTGLRSQQWVF